MVRCLRGCGHVQDAVIVLSQPPIPWWRGDAPGSGHGTGREVGLMPVSSLA
jgi:hypothetical protein